MNEFIIKLDLNFLLLIYIVFFQKQCNFVCAIMVVVFEIFNIVYFIIKKESLYVLKIELEKISSVRGKKNENN